MNGAVSLWVNDRQQAGPFPPGTSLLSALRDLGWKAVRRACETGDCGACTVWVEDRPQHSCITPVWRCRGARVTTLEGLAEFAGQELHPLQRAFLEQQAFQCGFCTAGMLMTLARVSATTRAEWKQALKGNVCRCTGYASILDAVAPREREEPKRPTEGRPLPHVHGPDIVTGRAVYNSDEDPPGLLHLAVLRSPYAHARIRRIETERARALHGVQAVLTWEDAPRVPYSTAGHSDPAPDCEDHFVLDRKVRFVGDRVAAAVADSPATAQGAIALLSVEYEPLPAVFEPQDALGAGAPVIHDEPEARKIAAAGRNLAGEVLLEAGSVETGFAEADLILEDSFELPRVQHAHLEPHVTTSWLDADGTLVLQSSTQVPFHCQRIIAQIFALPRQKVRVFKRLVGGGFGNKQEVLTEDLCALATLKTGRPVRWELRREEEFIATNTRHPMRLHGRIGVRRDGTLTAVALEALVNTGAYGNHGWVVTFQCGLVPLALYRCAHKRFDGRVVYTNVVPAGGFRGYGVTQGTFALECLLDRAASELGIEPLELRRRNAIRPGDRARFAGLDQDLVEIGSYGLEACIDAVAAALPFERDLPGAAPHRRRGRGYAVAAMGSGIARIHRAEVSLRAMADGAFELRTGAVDVGTGSDTTLRQIAAEALGVQPQVIRMVAADTARTPFDPGSYASGTTFVTGEAVRRAAAELRRRLESGSSELGVEVCYEPEHSSLSFAAQGVEVEVDLHTGRVEVLRAVQAVDCGRPIHPQICRGQAQGAIAMGIGYALTEEMLLDSEGRVVNPGFRFYRIPAAADLPELEVQLVETCDPYGPLGAKGIGEVSINPVAPAIASAVAAATGRRFSRLPLTPERIWQGLAER